MTLTVERFDARDWPADVLEALFAGAFPEFITADVVAAAYIERVRDWFGEFNIVLVDEHDRPAATGWGVPLRWSGECADLPSGYTDATRRAVEDRVSGARCDTFVICGGIADGAPLDPWLRTHVRLGGRIVATAPHSQTMTGTVAQWQAWTGMPLPSTGHYVIPDGLSTLYVDREHDLGTYTEPNVWVQHR